MNTFKTLKSFALVCLFFGGLLFVQAQERGSGLDRIRSKNSIMPAGGLSLINGDYESPVYQNFGQLGFKRFISEGINFNLNFRRHNLDYDLESFNKYGFMSLDLNVEYYVFPESKITPIVFLGGGLLADNDLNETNNKVQGGLGVEYLLFNKLGLSLMVDGNYVIDYNVSSTNQQPIIRDLDEFYFGAMLGINLYFGEQQTKKEKKRIIDNGEATVIGSFPILNRE